MNARELEDKIKEEAIKFGLFTSEMKNEGKKGTVNAVSRSNISTKSFSEGGAYFGYVRPEEAHTGPYYDVSFVVFPQEKDGRCIIAIAVGSAGFQRDYDLVSIPWLRRLYAKLSTSDGQSFIKNDFTNVESSISELLETIENREELGLSDLDETIKRYKNCILAACIVDPDRDFTTISAWLAQYAKVRGWGTNTAQRKNQDNTIEYLREKVQRPIDIERDIKELLKLKRFVVLQGAPGTGKTYNALKIAQDYAETYLIQFHAETSYTDFVGGIRPNLSSDQLKYEACDGKLVEAIKAAQRVKDSGGRVLLIIDEINRANLSNVLGPVFFLFETHADGRKTTLQVGSLRLSQLPENLDVLATMNTADRSLAVVDFALRRRFAWYTIRPQAINTGETPGRHFDGILFHKFCDIFERYASDEELNLQPGPSYFLTDFEAHEGIMKTRLIYELMPLIKEYLAEGLLHKAADSFSQLFYTEAKVHLYE
jgi:GTPase subunit of restriction endonuclease, putative